MHIYANLIIQVIYIFKTIIYKKQCKKYSNHPSEIYSTHPGLSVYHAFSS
ncbi:hypothetical protein HMPREF1598_03326 [Escherichia coli 907710]|nr:hypothetical protein HMPREF1598_03326 [Escherichia coli 907710]